MDMRVAILENGRLLPRFDLIYYGSPLAGAKAIQLVFLGSKLSFKYKTLNIKTYQCMYKT